MSEALPAVQYAQKTNQRGAKAGSVKNFGMDSTRGMSKMTRTTAASVNQTRNGASQSHTGDMFSQSRQTKQPSLARPGARSAVGQIVKPHSVMNNKDKHFQTAGDILNYPYSFDQRTHDESMALDNKLAK